MKVLVIDDDPAESESLCYLLQSVHSDIYTSPSTVDGIQAVMSFLPELIVINIAKTETESWEMCRKIRGISKAPILLLSVHNNPGMIARALDAGADDYLIKPFTGGVFISHINNLVRRSRTTARLLLQSTQSC